MTPNNSSRSMDIPILMYHHVHPVSGPPSRTLSLPLLQFVEQIEFLQRHDYTTITFDRLFRVLSGAEKKPRRAVLLTFDDGYKSFRQFVFPELKARSMTATVFIVGSEIGGFNRWDAEAGSAKVPLMSEAEIREIIAGGMQVGSHSWTHPNLTNCSMVQAREEIVSSKQKLEQRFNFPMTSFCYPYGVHTPEHFPLLAEAGYGGAVCITSDEPSVTHNRFAMRRVNVHRGDSLLRFRLKLLPWYLKLLAWRARKNSR